jgi:hypothetical protein
LLRNEQGASCGLDRVGKPGDPKEGLGIRRHTSPANHRIPHYLDAFRGKKIRGSGAKWLSFGAVLMARAAAEVYVFAGRAIVVTAVAATEMVDGLAREGFGGKSGAGDDDLSVFVLVSGGCGLVSSHIFKWIHVL